MALTMFILTLRFLEVTVFISFFPRQEKWEISHLGKPAPQKCCCPAGFLLDVASL